MKEIKVLLFSLYIACLTSSWWALAMFGPFCNGAKEFPLFLLPVMFTVATVVFCLLYMQDHWNDK